MIYNVVIGSGVQQIVSVTCVCVRVCVCVYTHTYSFPLWFITGCFLGSILKNFLIRGKLLYNAVLVITGY